MTPIAVKLSHRLTSVVPCFRTTVASIGCDALLAMTLSLQVAVVPLKLKLGLYVVLHARSEARTVDPFIITNITAEMITAMNLRIWSPSFPILSFYKYDESQKEKRTGFLKFLPFFTFFAFTSYFQVTQTKVLHLCFLNMWFSKYVDLSNS
jgi:hypothetical protein